MTSTLVLGFIVLLSGATTGSSPAGELPRLAQTAGRQAPSPEPLGRDAQPDVISPIVLPPAKAPFANLFRTQRAMPSVPGTERSGPARSMTSNPRIVCGLTLWQPNPNIQSKVRLAVPAQDVDFKIHRLLPSTCGE